MTDKLPTSFRLTDDARELIRLLVQKKGVSQTDIVELAIRKLAEFEKVKLPKKQASAL